MASARVVEEFVPPPPKKVILELTEDEAALVMLLTGNIGGTGKVRDCTTPVYMALRPLFTQHHSIMRTTLYTGDFPAELPRFN